MQHIQLIFDLDGTLSDPIEGIAASINYALAKYGFAQVPITRISAFIGPPIDQIFRELTRSGDPSVIMSCIAAYRDRYATVGYAENRKYEGIDSLLQELHKHRKRLGICTSKRSDFARKIVSLFDWNEYFDFISGGDVGIAKSQQIADLLAEEKIDTTAIMVGDRAIDITAAKENGLRSIGVLWGHGSLQELEGMEPDWIIETPAALLEITP